jgi:hypothetical protein
LKSRTILIVSALVFLISAESKAIIFGVRYSDINKNPLSGIVDVGSKGRFGMYFGVRQSKSVFLVGADYDRYKSVQGDTALYARRLTINLGYRYQLFPKDKVSGMSFNPFIGMHVFKSFSKVNADSSIIPAAQVKYLKDISNDEGGWVSFGGEYFFAPVFSFGAEAGLRYSRANSKALGSEIKIREYSTFVALLLSFYWQ